MDRPRWLTPDQLEAWTRLVAICDPSSSGHSVSCTTSLRGTPAEPADAYVRKGGAIEDTVGRKCLCNGLTATVGFGQTRRDGYQEPPIVTLGADLDGVAKMLSDNPEGWTAAQAVDRLLQ